MKRILPVILSGGYGTRLWPLSRRNSPKQFLKNIGSLFEKTLILINNEKFLPPIIISNKSHEFFILEAFGNLNMEYSEIILEPESKNTAITVFLASLVAKKLYGDDITLLVLPSDHLISDKHLFLQTVENGLTLSENYIVTFGTTPSFPATGYGYIEAGDNMEKGYKVKSFKEKPDIKAAEEFIEQEKFLWSCGIFLFNADFMCNMAVPNSNFKIAKESVDNASLKNKIMTLPEEIFSKAENISIDYLILEKNIEKLAVVKMLSSWHDIGDFKSIMRNKAHDEKNNVTSENTRLLDTYNTMVISKKLVAGIGLNNLIIVDTKDALLVANIDKAQDVKKIVEQIPEAPEVLFSPKVYRPWGYYEILMEESGYKVKKIFLNSNSSLSLQSHNKRAEHWVICEGQATVIKGETELTLNIGESVYIKPQEKHRVSNLTAKPLIIIEVQIGTYLGEDDIVRYSDIYGRQ